jgi:hypothetical protein
MHRLLSEFRSEFLKDLELRRPYRGKSGTNWLVSGVWSDCLKCWLLKRWGSCRFELPLPNRRRLDAALCREAGVDFVDESSRMDLALEWEWDQNKVCEKFPGGDFRKLFEVSAKCGLVIVQTRVDGRRGLGQANRTIQKLGTQFAKYQAQYRETAGQRDIALIEIRRVEHTRDQVRFEGYWWLNGFEKASELREWRFSSR